MLLFLRNDSHFHAKLQKWSRKCANCCGNIPQKSRKKKASATPKIFQVYKSNFFQRFSFLISIAKIGTENSATLQHEISAKDKLFHFVKSEDSLGRWVDGGFFIWFFICKENHERDFPGKFTRRRLCYICMWYVSPCVFSGGRGIVERGCKMQDKSETFFGVCRISKS